MLPLNAGPTERWVKIATDGSKLFVKMNGRPQDATALLPSRQIEQRQQSALVNFDLTSLHNRHQQSAAEDTRKREEFQRIATQQNQRTADNRRTQQTLNDIAAVNRQNQEILNDQAAANRAMQTDLDNQAAARRKR